MPEAMQTTNLPSQTGKILKNCKQNTRFSTRKVFRQSGPEQQNQTKKTPALTKQSFPGLPRCRRAQVRNQSERTTFHRCAHHVNRGRRNGSRNPTVSERKLVQERRRRKGDLVVGMPLQRRSPQDRAPLWSQEYVSTATVWPRSSSALMGAMIDFSCGSSPWIPIVAAADAAVPSPSPLSLTQVSLPPSLPL